MVEEVKRSSSKWIKSLGPSYHDFSWQEGYGAFSVSQSKVETVIMIFWNSGDIPIPLSSIVNS